MMPQCAPAFWRKANQPDAVALVDEHVHLVEQDAIGVLFGKAIESDEVHRPGIVQDFNEKRAALGGIARAALFLKW